MADYQTHELHLALFLLTLAVDEFAHEIRYFSWRVDRPELLLTFHISFSPQPGARMLR